MKFLVDMLNHAHWLRKQVDFLLLQNYIARFGHGSAKLARQAQSKEKTLGKMVAAGLTDKVESDKVGSCYQHFSRFLVR